MRFLVALTLVCAVLVAAAPTTTAETKRQVTMAKPRPAGKGHVLLEGRVTGSQGHVVLQRSADGRWVKVERLPVRKHGYAVTVPTRPKQQRFRVRAGKATSQIRIIGPSAPTKTEDACGKRPRKADGSRWACTFVDDFDAERLDRSRWLPQTNFLTGERGASYACYRNHRDNIAVRQGTLRLTLRQEPAPVACGYHGAAPSRFTAGMVTTYHLFSQRYGRFEARIKNTATTSPGLQEAFWMWPDEREDIPMVWPTMGEIDIVETYSQFPELAIPFLHYRSVGPTAGVDTAYDCKAKRGKFTTYTMVWTAKRIEILVNGKPCLVNTEGPQAFKRKYILALTQAIGAGANRHTGAAPIPATMSIDYVRVWE